MRDSQVFEIVPQGKGWSVRQGKTLTEPYATKEAAFEAAAGAAGNLIAQGIAVEIRVPARDTAQGSQGP